jgi:hypothetical protein
MARSGQGAALVLRDERVGAGALPRACAVGEIVLSSLA